MYSKIKPSAVIAATGESISAVVKLSFEVER